MTRRLLVSYLTLAVLVLLALEIPLGLLYSRVATARFLADVERDAVVLAERAEEAIEEGEAGEVPQMLAEYTRDTGGRALVVDPSGRVLADSGDATAIGQNLRADADIAAALRHQRRAGQRGTGERSELSVTVPAASGEKIRGVLRISYPASWVTSQTRQIWWILAGAGLAVLAIAGGVAAGLARWMTRPVRQLQQATAQLASGTLASPPPATLGPPELRQLTVTFTATAARLQHLIAAQRAFAADASHQLKTPLTALRLRLENLEPALDPGAHASVDEAVTEIDRLTRMVHGLLALARLEDGAIGPVAVDAEAVIAERASSWEPYAAEQEIQLAVTGQPVGHVRCVPEALEQILDNLLANALRAAPAGSTVTIHRRGTGPGGAEIHVIDQGPGMNATDRQRAFDRFWRAPDAADDGSGLGLAIVAHLARASGGHVTLDAAPGTGIDAVLRLPPAQPEGTTGGSTGGKLGTSQHRGRRRAHRGERAAVLLGAPGAHRAR